MLRRLRWGILSPAGILWRFVPALLAAERSELRAIASRSAARAREAAGKWGAPLWYDGYQALLDAPDIDAVYVPLPNDLHAEWVVRACEARKHVLCEKPIALSTRQIAAIQRAASAHGVQVLENYVHLHHPYIDELRRTVSSDAIGVARMIRGAFCLDFSSSGGILFDEARGGGSLWGLGCYPVSLAIALAGAVPAFVEGTAARTDGGVDHTFSGQMSFASGLVAQLACSIQSSTARSFQWIGSKGSVDVVAPYQPDLDGRRPQLVVRSPGSAGDAAPAIPIPQVEPFGAVIRAMERAVLDDEPPRFGLAFSASVTETLAALVEASTTGRRRHLSSQEPS